MKNKSNTVTIIVFLLLVFSVAVLNIFSKDKDFSPNENRYLNPKPQLSLQSIISGKYEKEFEQYLNDQFVFRDIWMGKKTSFQMNFLKKDINGVYICKDGYLIEKCLENKFENEQMISNINCINEFVTYCRQDIPQCNISVMVVPSASLILKNKMPSYAENFNQDEKIDNIKNSIKDCTFVDVRDTLKKHNDEYIYYKTDHHWTSNGAFIAYQKWCDRTGYKKHTKDDFKVKKVTDSFRGTLFSKVLNKNSAYDEISLYLPKNKVKYSVTYNFDKSKSNSMYDLKKLKEKDKYQVFFGGNYPEIKITTENKNDKNLLIIKDSFANSFIPFIINDFENICVVDLRYFKYDLKNYINENNITDVLLLYNIMNFSSDKNIGKLGE